MKELTMNEMTFVSGAGTTPPQWGTGFVAWDFSSLGGFASSLVTNGFQVGAGVVAGCVAGTIGGMAAGSAIGDNGGGVLGFGLIGTLGGVIVGGVAGFVGGLTAGVLGGFDYVAQMAGDVLYAGFNGSLVFW